MARPDESILTSAYRNIFHVCRLASVAAPLFTGFRTPSATRLARRRKCAPSLAQVRDELRKSAGFMGLRPSERTALIRRDISCLQTVFDRYRKVRRDRAATGAAFSDLRSLCLLPTPLGMALALKATRLNQRVFSRVFCANGGRLAIFHDILVGAPWKMPEYRNHPLLKR